MKYFLHDSNAFQDEKIGMLFDRFGFEGLGLFYTILEKLAYQEKPINTNVLKRQLHVGRKLEKCWKYMEEIDIISSNNGETFNENLMKFSEKFQIKSEKNRKRISEWRANKGVTKNVTRTESVCNSPKDNISKVNRIESSNKEIKDASLSIDFKEKDSEDLISKTEKPKEKSSAKKEKVMLLFETPDFEQAFEQFLLFRKQIKHPIVEASYEEFFKKLRKLSNGREDTAIAILQQSIGNGWRGIFELKNTHFNGSATNQIKQQSGNQPTGAELAYLIAS